MRATQMRELTPAELDRKLSESLRELQNLTLRRSAGKNDIPMRLRGVRREIARLRTVLAEKAQG